MAPMFLERVESNKNAGTFGTGTTTMDFGLGARRTDLCVQFPTQSQGLNRGLGSV